MAYLYHHNIIYLLEIKIDVLLLDMLVRHVMSCLKGAIASDRRGGGGVHPHSLLAGRQHAKVPLGGRPSLREHHGRPVPRHQTSAAELHDSRGGSAPPPLVAAQEYSQSSRRCCVGAVALWLEHRPLNRENLG